MDNMDNFSSKKNMIFIGIIVVLTLIVLIVCFLLANNGNKTEENNNNEVAETKHEYPKGKNNVSSFGIKSIDKNEYLYLNYDDGTSEKIYDVNTNPEYSLIYYIYADQNIYVLYNKSSITEYVDVIDLLGNKVDRFVVDELSNSNEDRDLNVYYMSKLNMFKFNLKSKNKEEIDPEILQINGYSKDNNLGIKIDNVFYYQNKEEKEIIALNLETDEKQTIKANDVFKSLIIVNNENYYYTDGKNLYHNNDVLVEGNDNLLFETIGLINDNNIQIDVYSSKDMKYYYLNYDIEQDELSQLDDGFERLYSLINLNVTSNFESSEKNNDNGETTVVTDYKKIELKSNSDKSIKDDLSEDIDENKIAKMIDFSTEEFEEYKEKFIYGKDGKTSRNITDEEQEIIDLAEYNFLVLENFILLSDESFTDEIEENMENELSSKYNRLFACVYSGIINYYLEDETTEHSVVEVRNTGYAIGLNELRAKISSNYLLSYIYRRDLESRSEAYEYFFLSIYENIEDFDEFDMNYNKYKNGENTYLNLLICSHDYILTQKNFENNRNSN